MNGMNIATVSLDVQHIVGPDHAHRHTEAAACAKSSATSASSHHVLGLPTGGYLPA